MKGSIDIGLDQCGDDTMIYEAMRDEPRIGNLFLGLASDSCLTIMGCTDSCEAHTFSEVGIVCLTPPKNSQNFIAICDGQVGC